MPMRQWVKITAYIDYQAHNRFGSQFIAVWQNGFLVSAAKFNDRINPYLAMQHPDRPECLKRIPKDSNVEQIEKACGVSYVGGLAQAHFGLYAPPLLETGTIYNDDLTISEIRRSNEQP